jgi:hypothetical protein
MLKLNVFPLWTLMWFVVKPEPSLSLYYAKDKIAHMPEMTQKLRAEAMQARRENRLQDARNILREALTLSRESADELDLAKPLLPSARANETWAITMLLLRITKKRPQSTERETTR